ncbi:MAG TPA: arginine repressor [Myxococcaceae bacterium]|nr:arginine repressor [Myxococcaceae bacterium]
MQARERRREAIRRLLSASPVGTQEELGALLEAEGFQVTQATLSRDLAALGAARVALPDGGTRYVLDEDAPPVLSLRGVGEMVTAIDDNGHLVVVRTIPGAASLVGDALDGMRLRELLGTVAGDDTLFCAPSKGQRASAVRKKLYTLFGKD